MSTIHLHTHKISRRRYMHFALQSGGGLVLASLLSACGTSSVQPNGARRYEIRILEQNQLDPASLTIETGATVVWRNVGTLIQTITCDPRKSDDSTRVALPNGASPWDSGALYPGQSWAYTFTIQGSYLYFSYLQNTPSMTGVIVVR